MDEYIRQEYPSLRAVDKLARCTALPCTTQALTHYLGNAVNSINNRGVKQMRQNSISRLY